MIGIAPKSVQILTDESGNRGEVKTKQLLSNSRRGCGELAALSNHGMYKEMHQELGRPNVFLWEIGSDFKLNCENNDDRLGVGSAHSNLRTGKPFTR